MNTLLEQTRIDHSRPFMPENLTPLFHTPMYEELGEEARLRYNQLNALYFNEQIMFFERSLALNMIGPFIGAGLPAKVDLGLRQFLEEEKQHSALFLELNRNCAPDLYHDREFYFVRSTPAADCILSWMSKRPRLFPLFLWLAHLQEERSMYFGRCFLQAGEKIEPNFRAIHRRHLADEVKHVQWDAWLLDYVWPQTGLWLRKMNALLLGVMVREFFATPKRSTLHVVRRLVVELPELAPMEERLIAALRDLGRDANYCSSIYSRDSVPETFSRFDACPELHGLSSYFAGYTPNT